MLMEAIFNNFLIYVFNHYPKNMQEEIDLKKIF